MSLFLLQRATDVLNLAVVWKNVTLSFFSFQMYSPDFCWQTTTSMGISTLKFLKFFTVGIIALEIICSRVNYQEMNVSYRKSASMFAWPARRCWTVLCSKTAVMLWEQFTSENSMVK